MFFWGSRRVVWRNLHLLGSGGVPGGFVVVRVGLRPFRILVILVSLSNRWRRVAKLDRRANYASDFPAICSKGHLTRLLSIRSNRRIISGVL